jgi:hypothetical protein
MNHRAVLYALASAALFGATTPLAKALVGSTDPFILAGLLYIGAGVGIAAIRWFAPNVFSSPRAREASLTRSRHQTCRPRSEHSRLGHRLCALWLGWPLERAEFLPVRHSWCAILNLGRCD